MSTTNLVVVICATLVTAIVIAWFVFSRQHPENSASHSEPDTTTRSERFDESADRPAGPGAETMDPDDLGGDHTSPVSS